jgi:hypothetical protein
MQFANVESLVVTFLRARAELSGIPVDVQLPTGYDGKSPIVVVSRVGGEFAPDDLIDRALVRVDTYGPSRTAALDLAGKVRGLIWLLPDAGLHVADVGEERGPSRLRDPAFVDASRYTTRYQLLVRIVPGSA